MNKRRFIERLNLHLDNELTSDESEELMTAARANPELFRIYRQYCMINEACAQLGDSFATPAARSTARQTLYALGGMAAAAALLFMAGRNLAPMMGQHAVAKNQPPSAPQAGPAAPQLARFDVDAIIGTKAFERDPAPSGGMLQFASFRVADEDAGFENWTGEYPFARSGAAASFARSPHLSDAPRSFHSRGASFADSEKLFSGSLTFETAAEFGAPLRFAAGEASAKTVSISGR